MKHLIIAILTYLALVLQAGWRESIVIGSFSPLFLPMLLAMVAVTVEGPAAIFWAAIIGLISDCLAAEALGIEMLGAILVVFVVQKNISGRQRISENASVPLGLWAMILFLMTEVLLVFSRAMRLLISGQTIEANPLFSSTVGVAACTTTVGLIVLIFGKLMIRVLPWRIIHDSYS
ncbi:MAG: hypothetical protein Tsb009_10340 [Planctomycetaceae bacterium]